MTNAPLPIDPQPQGDVPQADVPQGDMPGAFGSPTSQQRPAAPSRTKSIMVLVGLGILAFVVVIMALRDDDPNPTDQQRDLPGEPRR